MYEYQLYFTIMNFLAVMFCHCRGQKLFNIMFEWSNCSVTMLLVSPCRCHCPSRQQSAWSRVSWRRRTCAPPSCCKGSTTTSRAWYKTMWWRSLGSYLVLWVLCRTRSRVQTRIQVRTRTLLEVTWAHLDVISFFFLVTFQWLKL